MPDGLRVAGCRKLGTGRVGGAPSARRRRVGDWDAISELPTNFFLPSPLFFVLLFHSISMFFFFLTLPKKRPKYTLKKSPIQFKEKAQHT